MAVSRLDVSRTVKVHDSTAQSDIQAAPTDGKLDNVRYFLSIVPGAACRGQEKA